LHLENEVDGLIVYIPKNKKLCFLPPEVFAGKKAISIRLKKLKNNLTKGVIFVENYYW
jgi:hypothetical protein